MNTPYETIYELFFNRILNDRKFWLSSVSPDEMKVIAEKRAKSLLKQAVVIITTTTKYDLQIDFLSNMDEDTNTFLVELNQVEMELIADVMFERYLSVDITNRINALGTIFSDSDIKFFAPANELKSFQDAIKQLQEDNNGKILDYKRRDRDSFKRNHFSYILD